MLNGIIASMLRYRYIAARWHALSAAKGVPSASFLALRSALYGIGGLTSAARLAFGLLLLAGLPILLHGCHGDEDNELFAPLTRHFHRHGACQQPFETRVELLTNLR